MKTFISICKAAKQVDLLNCKTINNVLTKFVDKLPHRAPISNNKPSKAFKHE